MDGNCHLSVSLFVSYSQLSSAVLEDFSLRMFATVTTDQGVLIIGGWDGAIDVATVACYDNLKQVLNTFECLQYNFLCDAIRLTEKYVL